jgi:hypothetical protein
MTKRKPQSPDLRETQQQMVERLRVESYLTGPLAQYPAPRPESGPSAAEYFKEKFRRGEVGRFWLHHVRGWF